MRYASTKGAFSDELGELNFIYFTHKLSSIVPLKALVVLRDVKGVGYSNIPVLQCYRLWDPTPTIPELKLPVRSPKPVGLFP